jgi:hypothetical protein
MFLKTERISCHCPFKIAKQGSFKNIIIELVYQVLTVRMLSTN